MIYLDNAATSYPKPKPVLDTIQTAMKRYYANPARGGYPASLRASERVFEVREKAADFFGCKQAENVVFCHNCTTAVNTIIKGILAPGDHVIISDLEHNCVLRPLEKLRREGKIEYDVFTTDFYDQSTTLSHIRALIKPETKLLLCTAASNVLGVSLPLERIGALCEKRQIVFAVDGAQAAGILPVDMERMHIRFLAVAAHKGLFAPMGIGLLLSDGKYPLRSLTEGGTGSLSLLAEQPDFLPDKLEAGTLNMIGISAVGAGIDYICRVQRETIQLHEQNCIKQLFLTLRESDRLLQLVDYSRLSCFAPVFSFNIDAIPSEAVAQTLSDYGICVRAGFHCSALAHRKIGTTQQGTVRISPSFFTTKDDINHAISIIKKLLLHF